jgi:hypothetical protein
MATHPPVTGSSTVYVQGPLRYLAAQGFEDADATDLFQGVFALAFGHAMLSTSYGTIDLEGVPAFEFTEDAFVRTLDKVLQGYDPHRGE